MKPLLTISILLFSCTQPQQPNREQKLDSLRAVNTELQQSLDGCKQLKSEFMYANKKRFEEVMDSLYKNDYYRELDRVKKNKK